ncbi:MAG: UvrD-helicase domain-containing protein [Sedimentisphaerales bacterium]|nr:UvrD-helicase domain-containing protein [Sedimentisphaerales bacterium]
MPQVFLADLHIHSHFSVATSKELEPEHLDYWARIKGLTVVGTGDFTHPGWLAELESKLEPAEPGLFRLRKALQLCDGLPDGAQDRPVRFVLSAEVSTIYKRGEKTRKVHHLILAPDLQTACSIQKALSRIGNISSDGRPILGLDSRDLLKIVLDANPEALFIPAHIWTPWFSALGDKGGFDSMQDCYGEFVGQIYAIETGLSSDPAMNWRCSQLDRFAILSNSDAHNPENIGREANLFCCDLTYPAIAQAVRTQQGILGTIEFFPQEGKYHYDGHRKCNVCWHPNRTMEHDGICPVCNRPVTIGVMHRVVELADRPEGIRPDGRPPFWSAIPLKEILAQILDTGPGSKKVDQAYRSLIERFGSEFQILLHEPIDSLRSAGPALATAIENMRTGKVQIQEGFDGQYGIIRVFTEQDRLQMARQSLLFGGVGQPQQPIQSEDRSYKCKTDRRAEAMTVRQPRPGQTDMPLLDPDQLAAVEHLQGPALVLAGPGTGKTRVLTFRIAQLIQKHRVAPSQILAITFTRKAAEQVRQRLSALLPEDQAQSVWVGTFHQFGLSVLRELLAADPVIIDQGQRELLLTHMGCKKDRIGKIDQAIAMAKQRLLDPDKLEDIELAQILRQYEDFLRAHNLLDLEDLICRPARLLSQDGNLAGQFRQRFRYVLVDEYQDVNLAQYQILRGLCPDDGSNIFAIGDPNQAIYGFRGADVGFIRRFTEDYPSARIYRLSNSYRCSQVILSASGQIMTGQADRPSMLQGLGSNVKIQLVEHPTDRAEAEFVARTIERMIGGLRFFSIDSQVSDGEGLCATQTLADFAILCRTFAQMPVIEKALADHSIPYQIIGEQPFYQREPFRTILDRLRLVIWPDHPLLKARLSKYPALLQIEGLDPGSPAFWAIELCIQAAFADQAGQLHDLVDWARQLGSNVAQLIQFIQLAQPADLYDQRAQKVSLMTLHASKGLEFGCVFIVGCEEGLIPYSLFQDRKTDIEEERRLLYVGMTRARQWLYLSWARSRSLFGRMLEPKPSRFLELIQKELVEQTKARPVISRSRPQQQMTLFD